MNTDIGLRLAVAYLRRSSTKQEKSIAEQQKHVRQYASEHGYRIVHEYVDDGISGDDNEARKDFQRMIEDLTTSDVASVVLVWAYDRISRNDSDEESAAMFPLRRAGVTVESVTEGAIDRESFEGRITHVVRQEGRHNFLRDLAKNSLRGRLNSAQKGRLAGQAAPYGFDRMIMDEGGNEIMRIKNGDPKPTRGGNTHVTLVPSDDPEILATLRYIFEEFCKRHVGLRTLSDKLMQQGIPGPRGPNWYPNTIRHMLENEAYVGTFVYAKRTEAKFFKVAGDTVEERQPADYRKAKARLNDASQHIRVEGAFPALIDRELFDEVQDKLRGRKTGKQPRKSAKESQYPLSGLLICGCCGNRMTGANRSKVSKGKRYEYSRYVCSTYLKFGERGKYEAGCFHTMVDNADMTALITERLQETVLSRDHHDQIEEALRRKLGGMKGNQSLVSRLRKEVRKLDAEIEKAADRLLRAGDDLFDILAPRLRSMREERQRLARRMDAEVGMSKPRDVEGIVSEAMGRLNYLSREILSASPERRRQVLREIVDHVRLDFTQETKGKRVFSTLSGGEIHLYSEKNRDDKI